MKKQMPIRCAAQQKGAVTLLVALTLPVLMGAAALAVDLAYLHVMRAPMPELDAFALARSHFGERLILNDGFDPGNAEPALQSHPGAALSFARHFIGNPDLVSRMRQGLPLTRFDRKTLYTPGAAGYTSYTHSAPA